MNDDVGFVDDVRCCVYRLFSCTLVAKTTTNATLYEVLKWRCEVVVVLSHPDWNSSCPSVSTGVWVCGSTQRLHDPHASCAQLRHYQVPLQQAVPGLPQDSEGGVPAEHVAALRLRRPKIHDGWEQQLATTADPHTPSLELLTHSMGWGGGGGTGQILWYLSPSDFVRTFDPHCGTARVFMSILCPLLWM